LSPPERKQFTVNRLSRNPKLSVEIKEMYDFSCQVCGVKLQGHKFPIAVGAHIKDLGKPHNGPDLKENILCLCPNHHSLFDNFGFYIDPETLEINGLSNEKVNQN
jgi:putative restriction endonuclease